MRIIIYVLLAVNLTVFLLCGVDKLKAKRGAWRIPEAVLLSIGALGGSVGLITGMLFFHHKVSKPVFRFLAPIMLILHIAALVWIMYAGKFPAIG